MPFRSWKENTGLKCAPVKADPLPHGQQPMSLLPLDSPHRPGLGQTILPMPVPPWERGIWSLLLQVPQKHPNLRGVGGPGSCGAWGAGLTGRPSARSR